MLLNASVGWGKLRLLDDSEEPQSDDDKYDQDDKAKGAAHFSFLYVTSA